MNKVEEIIKDILPNLSIDPTGSYVLAKDLYEKKYSSYEDYCYNCLEPYDFDPDEELSEGEYQEIFESFIDDIIDNFQEWEIKKENDLFTIINCKEEKKHYQKGLEELGCWEKIENAMKERKRKKRRLFFHSIDSKSKNFQNWLEANYPPKGTCIRENWSELINVFVKDVNYGKIREEITDLDLSNCQLEGSLYLSDFVNLEKLDCSNNQLTKLDASQCIDLKELWCYNNQLVQLTLLPINQLETIYANNNSLTFFDYAHLNPQTLTELDISNNNLSETDITVFSSLINLVNLRIGSKDESVLNGQRNKFYGSLSSLQNLTKLKSLGISNTDIDSGLEYLSENLEEFYYSSFFFGFGKLENTLKDQVFASETYDPDNWRLYWARWMKNKKLIDEGLFPVPWNWNLSFNIGNEWNELEGNDSITLSPFDLDISDIPNINDVTLDPDFSEKNHLNDSSFLTQNLNKVFDLAEKNELNKVFEDEEWKKQY